MPYLHALGGSAKLCDQRATRKRFHRVSHVAIFNGAACCCCPPPESADSAGLTRYVWTSDKWQHSPDLKFDKQPQSWLPLHCDAAGNIMPLKCVDRFALDTLSAPSEQHRDKTIMTTFYRIIEHLRKWRPCCGRGGAAGASLDRHTAPPIHVDRPTPASFLSLGAEHRRADGRGERLLRLLADGREAWVLAVLAVLAAPTHLQVYPRGHVGQLSEALARAELSELLE
jgi:hypothetical protein